MGSGKIVSPKGSVQLVTNRSGVDPVELNADIKMIYDFNFRNSDTDYSLGWGVGRGWVLAVGGGGTSIARQPMIAKTMTVWRTTRGVRLR